ncbi:MAG TPA: PAS domain S-box protein, partial [Telluria sp.]|nr:PAS domain S-box protein [Telluria sp.]
MSKQQSERITATAPLPGVLPGSFGLAIVGGDGAICHADQAFAAITGMRADEVAGRPLSFFYRDSDDTCAARLQAALAQGQEFSSVVQCERPGGQPFRAELAVLPVEADESEPVRFVAVLRDMRAVGKTEAALDATARRFHDLLEHLPAGVVVHGKDSRILAVNRVAAELLGATPEELVGKDADEKNWRLLHSDGRPMRACEFPVCRALDSKNNLNNLVVGVDRGAGKGVIWALCNTYLVCDDSGALSEAVVCFTDCTELKRTEESLQKSEERLRLVLQGSNDAPWDWDLRTGEIYYSPRWWEMIGRPESELPSDPDLWQRLLHPEDLTRVMDQFERALDDGTVTYEVEMRLRHKDGHYVPVLSRGFILRDEQGRAV